MKKGAKYPIALIFFTFFTGVFPLMYILNGRFKIISIVILVLGIPYRIFNLIRFKNFNFLKVLFSFSATIIPLIYIILN